MLTHNKFYFVLYVLFPNIIIGNGVYCLPHSVAEHTLKTSFSTSRIKTSFLSGPTKHQMLRFRKSKEKAEPKIIVVAKLRKY